MPTPTPVLAAHLGDQRQFKTGVPQGSSLFPNIFTANLAPPVQVMSYADTSPLHLHTEARVQPRNTYNHTYIQFLP